MIASPDVPARIKGLPDAGLLRRKDFGVLIQPFKGLEFYGALGAADHQLTALEAAVLHRRALGKGNAVAVAEHHHAEIIGGYAIQTGRHAHGENFLRLALNGIDQINQVAAQKIEHPAGIVAEPVSLFNGMKAVHLSLDRIDFAQPSRVDILHQLNHRRIVAVHIAGLEGKLLFFHQIHQPVKVCVGGAAGFIHVHGKAPFRRPDGVFRQPPVFGFDADRVKAWVVQNLVRGFPANAVVNLFCLCKDFFIAGNDGKAGQLVQIALLLQRPNRRRSVIVARADLGNFQFFCFLYFLHFIFLQSN